MTSRSKELLDRAILAMVAAIEIYNKPGFPYRNESFVILAINGWELLLKAKWLDLHGNRKQSLYVYEHRETSKGKRSKKLYIKRTRSKTPFTHELSFLAKALVDKKTFNHSASQNIEIMLEFRDCATHFFNQDQAFETRLYEIGAACVMNFVNVIHEWYGHEAAQFNFQLMPLSFLGPPRGVKGSLLNTEESSFLSFLDGVDKPNADQESPYSVTVNVELKFIRSKAKEAFPVQVTKDESALKVQLSEENILESYPWNYATLTERCRQRFEDFKENQRYHDIRGSLRTDERFGHPRFLDPGNPKSAKKIFFNPNILAELDKHYAKKENRP